MESTIDLTLYSQLLWKKKYLLFFFVILSAAVSISIGMYLPFEYESEIVLYPPSTSSPSKSSLNALTSIMGLNLASDAKQDPTVLFQEVLLSRKFTKNFSKKYFFSEKENKMIPLYQFFHSDSKDSLKYELALSTWISELFEVVKDNSTGVCRIKVLAPERKLAADIANAVVKELKFHFDKTMNSVIKRNHSSIELSANMAKKDFDQAVNDLAFFRSKNRNTSLENSPQLFKTFTNLSTELEIQKEKYLLLRKELEMVKIEEIKDNPFIEVLDHAQIPAYKKYPQRIKIAVYGTILGGLLGCLIIIGFSFLSNNKKLMTNLINKPGLNKSG